VALKTNVSEISTSIIRVNVNDHVADIQIYTSIINELESGYLSRYTDGLRDGQAGFDSRKGQDFSLPHRFQTGSGAHLAFYPMGTEDSFLGSKAAAA
jgi:hypothetical protein